MKRVSIIIPVIREEKVKNCLRAIKENAGDPANYEVITEVDHDRIGCPKMLKRLTKRTQYDLVMFLGDDTVPQAGFLKEAVKAMGTLPDRWGVVGLATEDPAGWNEQAHFLAHKKMLEHLDGGAFYSTDYNHSYGEIELREVAMEMDRFVFAERAEILHDHPINFKGDLKDEDLHRVYSHETVKKDKRTYAIRKRKRMEKRHGVRLALAFPLTDIWTYTQFTFSILNVIMHHMVHLFKSGKSTNIDIIFPNYPGRIDAIRNDLANQALDLGCTHILMMDTDQIYVDVKTIEKLLDHNLPVVGCKVHRRYPPFDPIMLSLNEAEYNEKRKVLIPTTDEEIENNDLIQVGATGCGCILYNTEVFYDTEEPWFEETLGEDGLVTGEDIGFCIKLRSRGIDIYVDTTIDIKHLTTVAADWALHKLYSKLKEVTQNGTRSKEGD